MQNKIEILIKNNPILCAPICGYTDWAFREILLKFNPAVVFTEMLSVKGLIHNFSKTISLYKEHHIENLNNNSLFGIQIFGNNPDDFAKAVDKLNILKFDVLDINSGCSVKKIIKTDAGCALMKNPDKIYRLVKKTNENTDKIVTIKMRTGFDKVNYLECAQAAQDAGAKMITLHARTKNQMFSGKINFEAIKTLKENLNVPIIGNGEIWSAQDAANMIEKTNCDGVMLARGILGNPWLIKQCRDYINDKSFSIPNNKEKGKILLEHLKLSIKDKGEYFGIRELRKHIVKYSKGVSGSRAFRTEAVLIEKKEDLEKRIISFLFNEQEVCA